MNKNHKINVVPDTPFENSAILKINFALGWAALGPFFSVFLDSE